ncbi:uncharacterized protein LOC136062040 [Quercus suber]|uniref:uncharacterized protein LOC136062040 n=1 Tax=Quercus suber TaxID=58331 RepID=UPI0032DFE781
MAQRLEDSFEEFNIEHSLRSDNRFADALATLGSKVKFEGATIDVTIVKMPIPVESHAVLNTSDWCIPFPEYLIEGVLPDNHEEAYHLKKLATHYFVEGGILFRKGFNGEPLRCLGTLEAQSVMQEWVKAIPLKKATGPAVANFIQEHIICRFGIPYKIVTDNDIPFVNKDVRKLLDHRHIKLRKSTPYYPQGNGRAEATNLVLLRILSKMVHDYEGGWTEHLLETLWAY